MDTDFTTTQERYAQFLGQTPADIATSVKGITGQQREVFLRAILAAKRIIFTGTGSSMPAALYGTYELQSRGFPAMFMPLGSLLGLAVAGQTDLIVLCSQGMNRADAALVVKYAKSKQVPFIALTANTTTELTQDALLTCYFAPSEEKLFCRPDGVAANVAALAALIDPKYDADSLVDAWKQGSQATVTFSSTMRYITLASGALLPVNWNMALALREGCGALAQNFDIETYAHGNYVGDIAHKPYEYIVLTMDKANEASRSVRRFMPFMEESHIPVTTIHAPFSDAVHANLYILGVIAQSAYDANQLSGYNMNRPNGKEENRYYHEIESYEC